MNDPTSTMHECLDAEITRENDSPEIKIQQQRLWRYS